MFELDWLRGGRQLFLGGMGPANMELAGETVYYPSPRSVDDAGDPATAEDGDERDDEGGQSDITGTPQQASMVKLSRRS